jgi:large subunit ribosomal protein L22
MEARAVTRHVRISPQKARLVANLIRGKQVEEALTILRFTPKKAARILDKTLRAAIANAADTQNVNPDALYVKLTYVDGGTTLKRFIPRAHGRATPIRKRTSHFTVVVDEKQ